MALFDNLTTPYQIDQHIMDPCWYGHKHDSIRDIYIFNARELHSVVHKR